MESEIYSDYVSYDIQGYFCREPNDPNICLICAGDLSKFTIEPSKAMGNELADPSYYHDPGSSYLFTCNECRWWCIREHYEFIAKNDLHRHGDDYLIVGTAEISGTKTLREASAKYTQPCFKALDDPSVYGKIRRLPKEIAVLFKGGMTWEQARW
jgi:hypothetical protein